MTGATCQDPRLAATPHVADLEFRRLLETLPAGAYTCDRNGLITYFNRRAAELWGREPRLNDPVDRFCGSFKLFAPDGEPVPHDCCWMALAIQEDREYNGQEIVIERPDGTRWTALAHANPLHDGSGRVRGAVNVLVDITDRKQAEEAVRETDRRKSEFLALLAHELRNPLAPIRNGLQIIQLASHDRAAMDRACAMMNRQLGHLVRLIDDLLDLSRITNGKIELRKERINLADAVHDAVEASRPFIDERGHELVVALPPGPIWVDGDRTRLAQVFTNLLNNSARYTEPRGHVRLAVERQGSDAVVAVADDGIGIPATMLPHLFEMFAQGNRPYERSQGGLGVGLSLVHGLVTLHGGTVEARSAGPRLGSTFTVRLPALLPALWGQSGDGDDADRRSSRRRVLIVDDNEDAAESLALMLEVMGHDTRTAHDGLAGLAEAESFRPDVVLLDIGLPKLNGYDVCRRIREQAWGRGTVLIALTGWGQDRDRCKSKEAGFNFHMVKPVEPAALGKLLGELLLPPT